MMCKIVRSEKIIQPIFMKSNKRNKNQQSLEFTYSIDRQAAQAFTRNALTTRNIQFELIDNLCNT